MVNSEAIIHFLVIPASICMINFMNEYMFDLHD